MREPQVFLHVSNGQFTLLWASFPPTHAAIVLARGARITTESGVAMAVASAVRMQGFENCLGLFIALVLDSDTAP